MVNTQKYIKNVNISTCSASKITCQVIGLMEFYPAGICVFFSQTITFTFTVPHLEKKDNTCA